MPLVTAVTSSSISRVDVFLVLFFRVFHAVCCVFWVSEEGEEVIGDYLG